jgi:hypothetical protein
MKQLVLTGALFAGACGATDDRPRTLEYITETILAPSCATAECHSAFKQQVGDEFDTVVATRRSIVANALVLYPDAAGRVVPSDSLLIRTLTVGFPSRFGAGTVRMPYDAPMPDADIDLIAAWIADGASGAQCIANADGLGCFTIFDGTANRFVDHVVECTSDGNRGTVVTTCPNNQRCTFSGGNGQCK